MIELKNVRKEYRKARLFRAPQLSRGVEDLNLTIGSGAYGLLGINGAGKTTTLKMIGTLLRPSSGTVLIDGLDSVHHEKELRVRINMITGSDRMLYFRLTGRENLLYFASLYGMSPRKAKEKSDKLLELTGLSHAAGKRVEEYSRGMKQRLTIARGLINDPAILLLDEPTLGLDVSIASEVRSFIKNVLLGRGDRTVILTSHYMSEIEEICPRVGILQEGRLIYDGEPDSLYGRLNMGEIHRFSMPARYGHLKKRITEIIGKAPDWGETEGEEVQFAMDSERGYRFLKHMDTLNIKGLSYSQEKPGLEEAIKRLSLQGAAL